MGEAEGEYRYRLSMDLAIARMFAGSLIILPVAPIAGLWVALERWGALDLRAEGVPVQIPSRWWYAVPSLIALIGAAVRYSGIRRALLARRGGVLIGHSSIAVRDGHGLEQEWPWDRVAELRCGHYGQPLPVGRAFLELRDERGRKLQINHGLAHVARLRHAVLDRAGLTHVERRWWGETWTRPSESEADA